MVSYPLNPPTMPRCSACQLQLCKSRNEPPHAALKVINGSDAADKFSPNDTVYLCQTCAAVMVRSADLMEASWRHRR